MSIPVQCQPAVQAPIARSLQRSRCVCEPAAGAGAVSRTECGCERPCLCCASLLAGPPVRSLQGHADRLTGKVPQALFQTAAVHRLAAARWPGQRSAVHPAAPIQAGRQAGQSGSKRGSQRHALPHGFRVGPSIGFQLVQHPADNAVRARRHGDGLLEQRGPRRRREVGCQVQQLLKGVFGLSHGDRVATGGGPNFEGGALAVAAARCACRCMAQDDQGPASVSRMCYRSLARPAAQQSKAGFAGMRHV